MLVCSYSKLQEIFVAKLYLNWIHLLRCYLLLSLSYWNFCFSNSYFFLHSVSRCWPWKRTSFSVQWCGMSFVVEQIAISEFHNHFNRIYEFCNWRENPNDVETNDKQRRFKKWYTKTLPVSSTTTKKTTNSLNHLIIFIKLNEISFLQFIQYICRYIYDTLLSATKRNDKYKKS